MTRSVRFASLMVLAAALSFGAPANAFSAARANLDPARMFDRNAGSMISLTPAQRHASTFAAALFNVTVADSLTLPEPAAQAAPAVAHVNFTLPVQHGTSAASNVSAQAFATAAPLYADDAPLIAPAIDQPNTIPSVAATLAQDQPVRFGAYQPYLYVPTLQAVSATIGMPMRLGGLHFTSQIDSAGMQTLHPDAFHALQVCGTTDLAAPCPYLADSRAQRVVALTNFNLRAGNNRLAFQFSGGLEHIGIAQNAAFPYVPVDPDPVFGTDRAGSFDPQSPLLYYPGLTNVVQHSVGAKLAVPVTPRVTVGLQFERQHYQGEYGTLLFPGLDAQKDTYLGNVTYQLPYSSSAITLSARQNRYQDSLLQNFNLNQTRADLNFTVKF
ncbi:MAG TPA: hypothetical protein VFO29_11100 [Candidatus Rubrimentiphilum sp.]|nr:hypothetical protein [Candidatus Rubrimentiphilum sp.]